MRFSSIVCLNVFQLDQPIGGVKAALLSYFSSFVVSMVIFDGINICLSAQIGHCPLILIDINQQINQIKAIAKMARKTVRKVIVILSPQKNYFLHQLFSACLLSLCSQWI